MFGLQACWPQIPNYGLQLEMRTTFDREIFNPSSVSAKTKDGEREVTPG